MRACVRPRALIYISYMLLYYYIIVNHIYYIIIKLFNKGEVY